MLRREQKPKMKGQVVWSRKFTLKNGQDTCKLETIIHNENKIKFKRNYIIQCASVDDGGASFELRGQVYEGWHCGGWKGELTERPGKQGEYLNIPIRSDSLFLEDGKGGNQKFTTSFSFFQLDGIHYKGNTETELDSHDFVFSIIDDCDDEYDGYWWNGEKYQFEKHMKVNGELLTVKYCH